VVADDINEAFFYKTAEEWKQAYEDVQRAANHCSYDTNNPYWKEFQKEVFETSNGDISNLTFDKHNNTFSFKKGTDGHSYYMGPQDTQPRSK
jgi:hypothetical protein